jgi:hypothetical protein
MYVHMCMTISAYGLSKRSSVRLLTCLVPQEPLDPALVRDFVVTVVTNCDSLDANAFVLPVLRWTNCESSSRGINTQNEHHVARNNDKIFSQFVSRHNFIVRVNRPLVLPGCAGPSAI